MFAKTSKFKLIEKVAWMNWLIHLDEKKKTEYLWLTCVRYSSSARFDDLSNIITCIQSNRSYKKNDSFSFFNSFFLFLFLYLFKFSRLT